MQVRLQALLTGEPFRSSFCFKDFQDHLVLSDLLIHIFKNLRDEIPLTAVNNYWDENKTECFQII